MIPRSLPAFSPATEGAAGSIGAPNPQRCSPNDVPRRRTESRSARSPRARSSSTWLAGSFLKYANASPISKSKSTSATSFLHLCERAAERFEARKLFPVPPFEENTEISLPRRREATAGREPVERRFLARPRAPSSACSHSSVPFERSTTYLQPATQSAHR